MRCAASFAFSAVSPVSSSISLSLAPPSALMPPALFTSSTAIRRPSRSRMPWRPRGRTAAPAGRSRPPSAPARERARHGRRAPAAPPSARAPSAVRSLCCHGCRSPLLRSHRLAEPEIGPPDPVVRQQRLVRSVQHHPSGFQHVAVVGQFQRLGHALFHQQDGRARPRLWICDDALEDRLGHRRRQAHRRFVQHQQPRRGGEAAADRQHLLLAARQRAGELAGPLRQDREQACGCAPMCACHCARPAAG